MTSLKRAGADLIVTYWAKELARMDAPIAPRRGETDSASRLKRLALLWAQARLFGLRGGSQLPQCRYRADVAAYRPQPNETRMHRDLRMQTGAGRICGATTVAAPRRARLETVSGAARFSRNICASITRRCARGESLFPEWDSHDFDAIGHRGYTRVSARI